MRFALVVLALAVAGAARAETLEVRLDAPTPLPAIRLPAGLLQAEASDLFLRRASDEAAPVRPKGTVQTSIDHRFTASGDVVGSLGYLCGMQPGRNPAGPVRGANEAEGTFLGGQLRVAF